MRAKRSDWPITKWIRHLLGAAPGHDGGSAPEADGTGLGTQWDALTKPRTDSAVNLRPSSSGVDIEIRFVTRASERLDIRKRFYRRILDLLRQPFNHSASGQGVLSA